MRYSYLFCDLESSQDDIEYLLLLFKSNNCKRDSLFYNKIDTELISCFLFKEYFRFERDDIPKLLRCLHFPVQIRIKNRSVETGRNVLLMTLRRLSYPNRLSELVNFFSRSRGELSQFINYGLLHIYKRFRHLLAWDDRIDREKLELYSASISKKCRIASNCVAFLDGTVIGICRPVEEQESMYNGHHRFHAVKFQSLIAPSGIIIHWAGPWRGPRHDSFIFNHSNLALLLESRLNFPDRKFYVYADKGYGYLENLHTPNRNAAGELENIEMARVRIAVEWGFSKLYSNFAFIDYKKNLKIYKQNIGVMINAAAILINVHTCLYGSEVSSYFKQKPPKIEEYLQ